MSAKPAAIPLFGDAYLADTTHLTTEEHGAYFLLILAAWRQPDCSLPNDDKKLARIACLSLRKWKSIKATIMAFWHEKDGRIFQSRLTKEWKFACKKSEQNRKNSGKRWEKQVIENNETTPCDRICDGNAPPPPPIKKEEREEESPLTPLSKNGEPYAFAGRFVRLNRKDFDEREKIFHGIPDLRAELMAYDDWLSDQPEARQKKWFGGLGSWLSRRHQQAVERAGADDESVFTGPC